MVQTNRRSQLLLCLLLLVTFVGVFLYMRAQMVRVPHQISKQLLPAVYAQRVQRGSHVPMASLYGRVEMPVAVKVNAVAEGDVKQVFVRVGDRVTKGQKLLQIDASDYQRTVRKREAELAELATRISATTSALSSSDRVYEHEKRLHDLAQQQLQRVQKLNKNNVSSQKELEQAQRQFEQRRLAVSQAQAQQDTHRHALEQMRSQQQLLQLALEQAVVDRDRTQIYAVADGVVSDIYVTLGSRSIRNQTLLRIVPNTGLEVRAQLPSEFLPTVRQSLRSGLAITGHLYADGEESKVYLDKLLPEISPGQLGRTVLMRFRKDPQAGIFANQTPVYIRLRLPQLPDSYQVPLSAVYYNDHVYVITDNGALSLVKVKRLGYSYDEQGQQMMIFSSTEALHDKKVLLTHLPQAISGMRVAVETRD